MRRDGIDDSFHFSMLSAVARDCFRCSAYSASVVLILPSGEYFHTFHSATRHEAAKPATNVAFGTCLVPRVRPLNFSAAAGRINLRLARV